MIRQFGLYPRFFIKKWDLLQPLMLKYSNEDIAGKSKGQRIKLYFQLIKNNPEFRAEVDALIEQQGPKLLTVQQRIAGKKMNAGKTKAKNGQAGNEQSNFLNASEASTSDLTEGTEAEFIAAVEYEEKQEMVSGGLKLAGLVLISLAAWYAYKKFIK